MRWLAICFAVLAWWPAAGAHAAEPAPAPDPGEVRVVGPQVSASVDAGVQYWTALGLKPDCPRGIVVYLADLGTGATGLHVAGRAYPPGCRVDVDRAWVTTLTAPRPLCQLMVHEIGHLAGLGDGGTGNPVMDAPTLEAIPALPVCLAAFPTAPPLPGTAPAPEAPVPAPRLTLTALRAEAARALRASGRRVRPVACALSGPRRGTCRARAAGRSCRGRVYVTLSDTRGTFSVADVRCRRNH